MSLAEARESLEALLHNSMRVVEPSYPFTEPFDQSTEQWCNALDERLRYGELSEVPTDRKAAISLRLHLSLFRHVSDLRIRFAESLTNQSMFWDEKCAAFENMVDSAAEAVALQTMKDSGPAFSLELGFSLVMFAVVRCCRDPAIRRRALSLLQSVEAQDGVWNSRIVAQAAETLVHLEEQGIPDARRCEDIPVEARVSDMKLDWQGGNRWVRMNYKVVGSETWFTKDIAWR